MKWFYDLQAKYRILITIASWVPLCLLALFSGDNLPDGLVILAVLFIAIGVVFTVLTVRAHKKEHPAAEKKPKAVEKTKSENKETAPDIGQPHKDKTAYDEKVLNVLECSLVGCIYPNPDGTSRQTYLIKCKNGENVFFKPAPTKEYPDTIGVFTKKGGCIGVLPYRIVNELRGLYANNKAEVIIKEVTHSERGLGCIIKIIIYK